jgi:CRP/FNR family cyclic AMP-dependent transcriptional regulator
MSSFDAAPPLPDAAQILDATRRQRAYQSLGNHALLEHASADTVERFLAGLRLYALPAGARLLEEGKPAHAVFFLVGGAVRIVHQHDEAAFVPKVLAAPCHFGHMELIAGALEAFQSVDVVSDAVVAELPWSCARELLLDDHAFSLAWLEDLAQQMLHTAEAIRHFAFGDLSARIAGVLHSYAELSAADPDPEAAVSIPFALSLNTLSRHVASPKRSVVRIVQSLQAERLLDHDKHGMLTVPSRARLASKMPFRRLGLAHRGRLPSVLVQRRREHVE